MPLYEIAPNLSIINQKITNKIKLAKLNKVLDKDNLHNLISERQ